MNLEEREQLCRRAWETDYEFSQIDRFAKKEKVDTLSEIVIKLLTWIVPLK